MLDVLERVWGFERSGRLRSNGVRVAYALMARLTGLCRENRVTYACMSTRVSMFAPLNGADTKRSGYSCSKQDNVVTFSAVRSSIAKVQSRDLIKLTSEKKSGTNSKI